MEKNLLLVFIQEHGVFPGFALTLAILLVLKILYDFLSRDYDFVKKKFVELLMFHVALIVGILTLNFMITTLSPGKINAERKEDFFLLIILSLAINGAVWVIAKYVKEPVHKAACWFDKKIKILWSK